MGRETVKPFTVWAARIGLPLIILPASLLAVRLAREGQVYQAVGLAAIQAMLILWAVKAWAK